VPNLNDFKYKYLQHLSEGNSISSRWVSWKTVIQKNLNSSSSWGKEAFDLGDKLSDIFLSTTTPGRSQSTVSAAGDAWECLVAWYLNLVFWDTNVVVIKQNKKFVPESISNCLTVTISNVSTNTESDILIFSVPDHHLFNGSTLDDLNSHISSRINNLDLFVLQCKTNWEDNAQIPMLWDMIYNSSSQLPYVSIGINGLSPQSVNNFRYGFVTVPTGKRGQNVKPTQLKVLRVKNLTGGNYWGKPSQSNVASSIKELPSRNFGSAFSGGVSNHLDKLKLSQQHIMDNFVDLNFP
tara:strand:+ start:2053 stop:2934 length:882 start_codon:yes stop_codon:yes gene_type:complete